jgi:hypothetical protein
MATRHGASVCAINATLLRTLLSQSFVFAVAA